MSDLLGAPDITQQISCVKREIAMRERVYPRQVSAGKMKQAVADRELSTMQSVLATLEALNRKAAA